MESDQNELLDILTKLFEIKMKEKDIYSKQEFLDNYLKPAVDHIDKQYKQYDTLNGITTSLTEQIKQQDLAIKTSFDTYQEAMKNRELRAKEFVKDKTSEELKDFLAEQYVPYNSWKEADHNELVKIVLECYDE